MSLLAALQGGRPFGDPIFRCTTKDRGERRASSSQAPHPSFCLSGQKLSRSAAPPLPTKPTSLGFGGAPVPKPPFGFWLFIRGLGGETCGLFYEFAVMQFTRFRPVRRRAPEGSALGVPVVFALRGFAGKPSTTFFRQFHCRKHCFRRTHAYCSNCGECAKLIEYPA